MPTYRPTKIASSEITPRQIYLRRREFLGAAALGAMGLYSAGKASAAALSAVESKYKVDEKATPIKDVTTYNNFYEFGLDKGDPAALSGDFKPLPWTVKVDGMVNKPGTFDLEALIKEFPIEERTYRMRCVEAWSMVIPWVGIPLKDVVDRVQPTGKAQFIEFVTLHDVGRMPMQRREDVLDWPYVEGLRLDEARHPLALLAVGIYDEVLPPQNGAPIRLVVPWKYGFKGGKSIVKMRFVDRQPRNTWQVMQPSEYGFYANVNPQVDHPRWSQARERRLPDLLATTRTQMFNGYADQVASLYSGLDLRKNY